MRERAYKAETGNGLADVGVGVVVDLMVIIFFSFVGGLSVVSILQ